MSLANAAEKEQRHSRESGGQRGRLGDGGKSQGGGLEGDVVELPKVGGFGPLDGQGLAGGVGRIIECVHALDGLIGSAGEDIRVAGGAAVAEGGFEGAAGVEFAQENFEGASGGIGGCGELETAAGATEIVDVNAGGRVVDGGGGSAAGPGVGAGAVVEAGLGRAGADERGGGDLRAAGGFAIDVRGGIQSIVNPVGGAFGGQIDGSGNWAEGAGECAGGSDSVIGYENLPSA